MKPARAICRYPRQAEGSVVKDRPARSAHPFSFSKSSPQRLNSENRPTLGEKERREFAGPLLPQELEGNRGDGVHGGSVRL